MLILSGNSLERKLECSGTVHQLFIYLKETPDWFATEIVYNILAEFYMLIKLAKLEMC
jgi:hypothetical protein